MSTSLVRWLELHFYHFSVLEGLYFFLFKIFAEHISRDWTTQNMMSLILVIFGQELISIGAVSSSSPCRDEGQTLGSRVAGKPVSSSGSIARWQGTLEESWRELTWLSLGKRASLTLRMLKNNANLQECHWNRLALGSIQWWGLVKELCTELTIAAEHMNWVKSIRTVSHGQLFHLLVSHPHCYLTVS